MLGHIIHEYQATDEGKTNRFVSNEGISQCQGISFQTEIFN